MDSDQKLKEEIEFWRRVAESGGFDVDHLMDEKPRSCLLRPLKFENSDCPTDIALYARLGIHKYNMIKRQKLQLSCVEKCNERPRVIYQTHHITLVAKDPAASNSLVTFQTKVVEEEGSGIKSLTCDIARPKFGRQDTVENPKQRLGDEPVEDCDEPVGNCYSARLPEWPSENAFNDINRFYVVKKSELRKNDWIRLYMELAFLHANTNLKNPNLSKLAIVKVAVETKEDENVETPKERLKARNAIFYIKYKYCPSNQDRIAIVRRRLSKSTGDLNLMFHSRFAKTLL